MYNWLGNQLGFNVANFILLVVGIILIIIAIIIVIRVIRRLTSGTYIAGGNNRQPRLSVQDALPIDKMRQIVLINRDGVEHLIMIGGPNDLVIETNIRNNNVHHQYERNEPIVKIDDLSPDIKLKDENIQTKQPIISEPKFSNLSDDEVSQMASADKIKNVNVDRQQNSLDDKNIQTVGETPTRLHPTYPLKQVSAGIYAGRTTRSLDEQEPNAVKNTSMRIENPYRKEPQQPNPFTPNEKNTKIEPKFSNSQTKTTMEFPEKILKDSDTDPK